MPKTIALSLLLVAIATPTLADGKQPPPPIAGVIARAGAPADVKVAAPDVARVQSEAGGQGGRNIAFMGVTVTVLDEGAGRGR